MPNRHTRRLFIILFMAAFGWMTTKAASVYTETFTVGSNGWHWIPPSSYWQGSITGGYASVTANPFTGFPPVFNRAILSSTNTPVVSGGAFTGDYQVAQIARMGFNLERAVESRFARSNCSFVCWVGHLRLNRIDDESSQTRFARLLPAPGSKPVL